MAGKSFMFARSIEPEEAFEYLKVNLRSTKISNLTYNPNMKRIEIGGNYYNHQVSFIGNQMTITPKMVQKWMIILIACALTGLVLWIPFIIVIVFIILMSGEVKEINTLVYQTMNMMPAPQVD